jgi:hypothetical protein
MQQDPQNIFIDYFIEDTDNDYNRTHKNDFVKRYQGFYNLDEITWNTLINDVKRSGLKYDRTKQANNKKGAIMGLT